MTAALWLLLGLVLGGAFVAAARSRGGNETRVLALGLVVAAAIYVGFAVVGAGAGAGWTLTEAGGIGVYGAFAWLGLRRSAGWLAAGWALHTVWDVGLHLVGGGAAFAPTGYVVLCVSFDLLTAAYVAFGLRRVAPGGGAVA